MTDRATLARRARVALELLLGACTLWLIVQNIALLAFMPWQHAPAFFITAAALLRAAFAILREAWPLAVVALATTIGVIATLARHFEARNPREARHV